VIKDDIGEFDIVNQINLKRIILNKPTSREKLFYEHSKLNKNCWKLDIYD